MAAGRSGRRGHGELETEIAAAVAAADKPVTVRDVIESVDTGLSYVAVHAILNRLISKGLVERDQTHRGNIYRPAQDAAEVVAKQMDALLQRGPSRREVLHSFLNALSGPDEQYLKEWLRQQAQRD